MSIEKGLIIVALAGALGAMGRFLVGVGITRMDVDSPWATLTVNLIGCFLFGLIAYWASEGTSFSPAVKLALLTGFLGAFTTFSAYSYDTLSLYQSRGVAWAVGYVLAQNALGIGLAAAGVYSAKYLTTS